MKICARCLIVLLGLAALILSACEDTPRQASPPASSHEDSLAVGTAEPELPKSGRTEEYAGAIDGRYAFRMTLYFDEGRIEGSYQYENQQEALKLEGHMQEEGIQLQEYDPAGKPTGTFRGQLDPITGVIGEWKKSGDTTGLRFDAKLIRTQYYVPADWIKPGVLEVRTVSRARYSPDSLCSSVRQYPVFSGFGNDSLTSRLNAYFNTESLDTLEAELRICETETKEFARESGMRTTEEESYSINYLGPEVISISSHYYSYFAGAAHGNYGSATANFNPETGKLYRNSDLFRPRFKQELNKMIREQIEAKYPNDILEFEGIDSLQNFEVFPDRLVTYFNPYEIGAYALGQIRFEFDYAELKGILRKNGPLSPFPKR